MSTIVPMLAGGKSSSISAISSSSASQPTDVAYQPDVVKVRIGNFNMGISQLQFSSNRSQKKLHANICRVVDIAFHEGDLDILATCELGKHKEGNTKKVPNVRILISLPCFRQTLASTLLQRLSRITQSYSHRRMIRSHQSRGLNCGETNRGKK